MITKHSSRNFRAPYDVSSRLPKYAYMHEREPPNAPLKQKEPEIVDTGVDDGLFPGAPNGDEVGFVSLNQAGDQSGSFHPSENTKRRIVARSMIDVKDDPDDDDDLPEDTFDATVVELDVSDYLNGTKTLLPRIPKDYN